MKMLAAPHPVAPGKTKTKGDPLEYISASRLKMFAECRLKFYFKYVEQVPLAPTAALFIGKVTHRILQQFNLNRWRGLPADAVTLQPLFLDFWQQMQPQELDWEGQEVQARSKTWGMVAHYLANTPISPHERVEAVEVTVERDLEAHGLPPLKGVIDLVRQGGVIVDFKTSARTPTDGMAVHHNEVQLGCYALLYREATGKIEGGFELHHLVKTKEPKLMVTPMTPFSAVQMRRLVRIMESYVQGVKAQDWVPSSGQHCAWCDYFRQCRAWDGGGPR